MGGEQFGEQLCCALLVLLFLILLEFLHFYLVLILPPRPTQGRERRAAWCRAASWVTPQEGTATGPKGTARSWDREGQAGREGKVLHPEVLGHQDRLPRDVVMALTCRGSRSVWTSQDTGSDFGGVLCGARGWTY